MRNEDIQAESEFRDRRSDGAAHLKPRISEDASSAGQSGPLDDETRNIFQILMAESRHETAAPDAIAMAQPESTGAPGDRSDSILGLIVAFGFGALAVRLLVR